MSRMSSGGDQILIKPTNNVYTVLVVVGIVAEIVAIAAVFEAAGKLFGPGPWW